MGFVYRQRMGLTTLCLLICAESVYLTNAVTFWNQYNQWSTRHEGDFESPFTKAARKAQECAVSDHESCPAPPAARTTRVYPRARLHFSAPIHKSGDKYCRECHDRCGIAETIQSVRGGHTTTTTPIAEAAAAAAEAVTPYGIPLNGWKVIFQTLLTAMNVACWLIPLKSKKMSENKVALSLANAFSGGVFLSLAFGHLLPECVHGFEGMNEATPYMLALGGYLLIFFVEKVAFDTEHLLHDAQNGDSEAKGENALATGRGAVILLAALAVHSILEMAALGLADTFGDSALLTLSIALHQVSSSTGLCVLGEYLL